MRRKNLLAARMQNEVQPEQQPQLEDKKAQEENAESYLDNIDTNAGMEALTSNKEKKFRTHRRAILMLGGKILVILLCIYTCFLIFGLLNTEYVSDSNGEVHPEVLTMQDIGTLKEYEKIETFYLRLRTVYESALKIDCKLAENAEQSLALSMDYADQLEVIDKLMIDLSASGKDAATRYEQYYRLMLDWSNCTAQYLQYMNKALSLNDAAAADQALAARNAMYAGFAQLTSNMVDFAKTVKGSRIGKLYDWSPETFVESLKS